MAELVDWMHHESVTRAATNTANGTIGQPFGNGLDVCPVCGKPSTIGRKTNADRIRAMTDEELATFLGFTLQDGYCYGAGLRKELKFIPVSEHNEMVEWLKKEVGDGDTD